MDYNTSQAISEFLQSEKLAKKLVNREKEECGTDMCKALDDLYQEGIDLGEARGRAEGRTEGRSQMVIEILQELGNVPGKLQKKIRQETDLTVLKQWCRLAVTAETVAQFEEAMRL